MLDIRTYDEQEAKATKTLSYPAIRAFRPAAFGAVNFPTRVTEERELLRYADIMNELDDRSFYFEEKRYSAEEADLMVRISDLLERFTAEQYDRPTRPFMSLFAPIDMLRAVLVLAGGEPVKVFEIGPGSGFLGAYLMNAESVFGDVRVRLPITYCATDNTQALYLWQNRFFAAASRDGFEEFAGADMVPDKLSSNAHVPWWQFAELYKAPPSVDIVICDAAMGEMDPFAANYVIRLAAEMLREATQGAFLYRHLGEQRHNNDKYIEERFEKSGFVKQKLGSVMAFSLGKPLDRAIVPPPMGTTHLMRPARDFLRIDPEKLLPSYEFFDFIRLLD